MQTCCVYLSLSVQTFSTNFGQHFLLSSSFFLFQVPASNGRPRWKRNNSRHLRSLCSRLQGVGGQENFGNKILPKLSCLSLDAWPCHNSVAIWGLELSSLIHGLIFSYHIWLTCNMQPPSFNSLVALLEKLWLLGRCLPQRSFATLEKLLPQLRDRVRASLDEMGNNHKDPFFTVHVVRRPRAQRQRPGRGRRRQVPDQQRWWRKCQGKANCSLFSMIKWVSYTQSYMTKLSPV